MKLFLLSIILGSTYVQAADDVYCTSATVPIVGSNATTISYGNTTYLAPGQDCTYKITFDNSSLLLFFLNAKNVTSGDAFYITDAFGNQVKRTSQLMLNRFPPPTMTVRVTTGPQSRMTFDIVLLQQKFSLENVNNTVNVSVEPTLGPTVLNQLDDNTTYVIESTSRIALSVVDNSRDRDPSHWMEMFVYEGTGGNATLIGTMYSALSKPLVSSGNSMTIYSAARVSDSYVVVNSYSNVKDYTNYETGWAYTIDMNRFDVLPSSHHMDATNGPAALTIGWNDDFSDGTYLEKIVASDSSATLSVISGAPNSLPKYQLFKYNCNTVDSYLPQQFPLQLTTFVLSKGTAELQFSAQSNTNWTQAYLNRGGLIMTNNFPFPSANPNIETYLGSGVTYDFKFDLLRFDDVKNGDDSFTIVVNNDKSTTFSMPLSTFKNHVIHVTGYSVQVNLNSSSTSMGTLISFEINQPPPITTTTHSESTGLRFGLAVLLLPFLRMLSM